MAAHLDLIHLRRHALPVHFMTAADRLAEAPARSGGQSDAVRPPLVATWQLDVRGHPVCNWSVDTNDPLFRPA